MEVRGFRFAAAAAGMRYRGRDDVGLIVSDRPAAWAGVFTTSSAAGAPILLARERLARGGAVRAVLVNAGIANAGTGRRGLRDARAVAGRLAAELGVGPGEVLCASTGRIGVPLPVERFAAVLPELAAGLAPDRGRDVARAMATSDRVPKVSWSRCRIGGRRVSILGLAKGSGMIAPDMATLLAFLLTDARATPAFLRSALREVVDESFNALTVDGDMSTSDMALLLASGSAGGPALHRRHPEAGGFRRALRRVTLDLTRQLARDGEGARKLLVVVVRGARSREEARRAARSIARSNLFRAAVGGGRLAWGWVVAAVGAAGVGFAAERLGLKFGGSYLLKEGRYLGAAASSRAEGHLQGDEVRLTVELGRGRGEFTYYTCDLTEEYVALNAAKT